ncbi:hypothetical protein, partial [Ruminococcus sp.]|uniref:hypothetical protein n=1 Tax=Ruminococcus sp. TaxID=41978 RepID=UPI00345D986B
ATLKKEKLYQIPTYRMKREEVKTIIFRYIFGYYNTQRINSFNEGGLPPVALRTYMGYVQNKWKMNICQTLEILRTKSKSVHLSC